MCVCVYVCVCGGIFTKKLFATIVDCEVFSISITDR